METSSIKFSSRTLEILRNFSTICPSIIIQPGKSVYTSRDNSIIAWAEVEEEFTHQISIYRLANFLSVVERMDDAHVEIGEHVAIIKNKRSRVKYKYTDPVNIKFDKKPVVGKKASEIGRFIGGMTSQDIQNIRKMASTLELQSIQIVCKSGKVFLKICKETGDGNTFEVGITKGLQSEDFCYTMDITRLVMMQTGYSVYIKDDKALILEGDLGVTYCLCFDAPSSNRRGT